MRKSNKKRVKVILESLLTNDLHARNWYIVKYFVLPRATDSKKDFESLYSFFRDGKVFLHMSYIRLQRH